MAQEITAYKAVTTNRAYIFYLADGSTGGVQYERDTPLRLPADYASRITNSRYPVTSPMSGWMNWVYVGNIEPIYNTTTDRCTPPDSLSINTSTMVLTISGGAGGDQNEWTGFGVSWRERSITSTNWGNWSADTVTNRTVSVKVNAGRVRQYRVRTLGSAGSDFYSEYVVCSTLLSGNAGTGVPTIMLPSNEAVTGSKTPVVIVSCGSDPESDQMTLQRSVDGGSWASAASLGAYGGTVYDRLPTLNAGRHTVRYRLVDRNGAAGAETSVTIVVGNAAWTRTISTGDIISNAQISHQADITEMLNAVNVQRLYYGLEVITLPGTVGRFADWGRQMETLLAAANECLSLAGQQVTLNQISGTWPNAETINNIRSRILMV